MNRKGFTLVELLAVILILSGISLVAVASISSSLDRRGTKECEEQIAVAINSAKLFFSINGYYEDGVTIGCLRGDNSKPECAGPYLEENPQINEPLDPGLTIKINNNAYKIYKKDGTEYKCS